MSIILQLFGKWFQKEDVQKIFYTLFQIPKSGPINLPPVKTGYENGKQRIDGVYRSYSRRWFLLWTVTLLNVANYAHWISYASVYSKGIYQYCTINTLQTYLIRKYIKT